MRRFFTVTLVLALFLILFIPTPPHDGSSFDIIANTGEKIKINFKKQDLIISGSPGTNKLVQLDEKLIDLTTFRDSITKELQELSRNEDYENIMLESRKLFFEKLNTHKSYLKEFIEENKENIIN